MKLEKLFIGLLLAVCFVSCSKDDEPGNGGDSGKNPNQPENNSSVTINSDGSTSTKAVFSPIDETTFYIDYVKYQIVDSHLEIIGYDPVELKGDVKPYASVKYLGTTYNTRIINSEAFRNCKTITSINIPSSVTGIGYSAFEGCSSLTSVTIPSSVTEIGQESFEYCSALIGVTIPGSVTEIGAWTFRGCSSLTSVTIPSSITKISNYAFSGCSSLASVTIPSSVTTIGYYAFGGCSSLTGVTIPSSVTEIGYYAFGGCSSLTSVTIPSSVTSICNSAFYNCLELLDIYIGTRPYVFSVVDSYWAPIYDTWGPICDNATLHVKAENLEWFKSHREWSKFKNIVGDYNP